MTRSLRVSHASVAKRDPHLARGVEQLLAASVGIVEPPPPAALPVTLGDRRASSRIAVAPAIARASRDALAGDDELVALGAAATAGAGVVVTPRIPIVGGDAAARINTDEQAVAWKRIVEYVHGKGARIVARIATGGAVPGALEEAVQRAAFADFDLLLLDPGADPTIIEQLPAMVAAARGKWRTRGWIAAAIHDKPTTRAAVVGHAAQLIRAGANLLWVSSAGDALMAGARLPAAPLADRLRNELGIATCVEAGEALLPDLDAAVGAGRADLVTVDRIPAGMRPPAR
jgi:2,4-dienoyl-CoA reductase-like NADH-dependent reductase (Old Yellow Enzyme family)